MPVEKVRAKFYCRAIEYFAQPADSGTVKFSAVYGNGEENKEWSKWTPSGEISMNVSNPAALEFFKLGEEYYIDFTLAPKVAK